MTILSKRHTTGARYGNQRSGCSLGHSHRSKLEVSVCQVLQLREKAGELILEAVEDHIGLTRAKIKYIADFRCRALPSNELFWVEAKGFANDRWPIIKKLWAFYGPGRLEIWQGSHLRPLLVETITPDV